MAAGTRTTFATLAQVVAGKFTTVVYDPPGIWVWIQPSTPTAFDEAMTSHLIETEWHPQMSTNTILRLDDGRVLYVRGITDLENRHVTHRLVCEEKVTP